MTFAGLRVNFQRYKGKIILAIAILSILAIYALIHWFSFFSTHDAEEIHFSIFLATVALVLIAYYEFDKSNKLSANEFLLFISNKWNCREIIKARQIIHEIFINAYRNNEKKVKFQEALSIVSDKILEMSKISGDEGKKFIYLLNLLDYLETLSYFWNRDDLNIKDVQNTCGNNAIFFYECFKSFIEKRQSHNEKYYINFTALYKKLNTLQEKVN